MPRMSRRVRERTVSLRRSSRLNGTKAAPGAKSTVVVEIDRHKPRRRRCHSEEPPHASPATRSCHGTQASSSSSSSSSRSAVPPDPVALPRPAGVPVQQRPATAPSLRKREQALLARETELDRRVDMLQGLLATVAKKEEEMALQLAETTLALLEEHFTCSLCYEVMACPYTLTPKHCGHTFCALCILKWFMSRIHQACGSWHDPVDCPVCRSLLILTPAIAPAIPRPESTFPFTPNRALDVFIQDLVEKLSKYDNADDKIKLGRISLKTVKRESLEASAGLPTNGAAAWKAGGILRTEWINRDRIGRIEMQSVSANWATLRPVDFLGIKIRLQV